MDIVCAFLAILVAVKTRMISVFQNRMFGDIVIRPFVQAAEGTHAPIEPVNGEKP
jgi:segregation and condensation protein A